jgi:hypothetical protein
MAFNHSKCCSYYSTQEGLGSDTARGINMISPFERYLIITLNILRYGSWTLKEVTTVTEASLLVKRYSEFQIQ